MTRRSMAAPILSSFRENEGAAGKNWQREILSQAKVWKVWEYLMYFSLSELHGCGKRSVVQPQTVASEFSQKLGQVFRLVQAAAGLLGKIPNDTALRFAANAACCSKIHLRRRPRAGLSPASLFGSKSTPKKLQKQYTTVFPCLQQQAAARPAGEFCENRSGS